MTYYHQQVQLLTRQLYPKDDLTKNILQAKAFMDQYFNEKINLDKVAARAFISKFHFIRIFKVYYGCTPHHYLMNVRIEQAKKQLGSGDSIATTCFAIGFESISSFMTLFKKITGQTPLSYQRKQFCKE